MVGSWVRKWFFSAEKMTNDRRRRFSDRRSISYSRLVKIFVEGALATLAAKREVSTRLRHK